MLNTDVRGATLKTRNPGVYKVQQRGPNLKSYLVLGDLGPGSLLWGFLHGKEVEIVSKQVGGAASYSSVVKALASVVKCTIS